MQLIQATIDEAARLGADPSVGLSSDAVEKSRAEHGQNRVPPIKGRSIWSMFLGALKDKTILVLIGAACVALGVELAMDRLDPSYVPHYIDGVAIWVAVLVATLVSTANEARAAKEFRSLARVREDIPVKTLRDGHVRHVSVYDIVVGDIVFLESGDRAPADGSLLRGVDLGVDQSSLTGESEPAHKDAQDREILGSSIIVNGSGSMLVTAVGTSTEMGKLQARLGEEDTIATPLQERLAKLADQIGLFGFVAAVLTFAALTASFYFQGKLDTSSWLALAGQLLEFLIIGVTIVVVAVPEGLPVAVTISLAYSVRKMARDKSLVRHLASCETMGAATVICSDKTGTLTENRMSVTRIWFDGRLASPEDVSDRVRARFADVASIDSTAFLERKDDGTIEYVGNPTEGALLRLVEGWDFDWKAIRAQADMLHQFGFTSERKRMSTVVGTGDGAWRVLTKGAPEVVLARCSRVVTASGVEPLTPELRENIERATTELSSSGRRTLALAVRDLPAETAGESADELESDLTLVALAGINDPVRKEVSDAIIAARAAGVEVKMVTGDNRHIAESIANELALMKEGDAILEGPELREMSDEALQAVLPRLRVLARSVPSDKYRLVEALQAGGHVVAVTGDGTNDAPALKKADVGFAMGLAGTEVAKEASDIVILDDNFASIVRAIRWGRSIFENIRKFLQFQLTVNVAALSTAFLAAVFGFGIPLNTVQLLWVNLIMDALAALALAVEPPSPRLLKQAPHGRHAPLITRSMWISILATGGYMVFVLMIALWTQWIIPSTASGAERLTFVFNAFVFMQLFNELNARSTRFDRGVLEGLQDSHLFGAVVLITTACQVAIIEIGGEFFRTVPLDRELWLRSIGLGLTVLVFGALLRFVGRQLKLDADSPSTVLTPR